MRLCIRSAILAVALCLCAASPQPVTRPTTRPAISSIASSNGLLGSPSDATTNPKNRNNYLLIKPYFLASYNSEAGEPNWVSWVLWRRKRYPLRTRTSVRPCTISFAMNISTPPRRERYEVSRLKRWQVIARSMTWNLPCEKRIRRTSRSLNRCWSSSSKVAVPAMHHNQKGATPQRCPECGRVASL
jgi:hypothetical protein